MLAHRLADEKLAEVVKDVHNEIETEEAIAGGREVKPGVYEGTIHSGADESDLFAEMDAIDDAQGARPWNEILAERDWTQDEIDEMREIEGPQGFLGHGEMSDAEIDQALYDMGFRGGIGGHS